MNVFKLLRHFYSQLNYPQYRCKLHGNIKYCFRLLFRIWDFKFSGWIRVPRFQKIISNGSYVRIYECVYVYYWMGVWTVWSTTLKNKMCILLWTLFFSDQIGSLMLDCGPGKGPRGEMSSGNLVIKAFLFIKSLEVIKLVWRCFFYYM